MIDHSNATGVWLDLVFTFQAWILPLCGFQLERPSCDASARQTSSLKSRTLCSSGTLKTCTPLKSDWRQNWAWTKRRLKLFINTFWPLNKLWSPACHQFLCLVSCPYSTHDKFKWEFKVQPLAVHHCSILSCITSYVKLWNVGSCKNPLYLKPRRTFWMYYRNNNIMAITHLLFKMMMKQCCLWIGTGETASPGNLDSYLTRLSGVLEENPHKHRALLSQLREVLSHLDRWLYAACHSFL